MVYFHPYLGKISNLTNIFQMGWNHQLANDVPSICESSSFFQDDRIIPWVCDASVKPRGNVSKYCGCFTVVGPSDRVSNEKTGCFGYIGDYTTQLYGDYNKPL